MGNRFGTMHLPRVGQEVLVIGIHGDPDCLVAIERVYNKMNLLPWALPQIQMLLGPVNQELPDEEGHSSVRQNRTLADDTPGQPQAQIGLDFQLSELALGHIVAIPDQQGRRHKHGEGYELRTDAWGVMRASMGILLTTYKRNHGDDHALSMGDTVDTLQQAECQIKQLADVAQQANAQNGEQKEIAKVMVRQHVALKGDGPPKEFMTPQLASTSLVGIAASTPGLTHLQSGTYLAITTGDHVSITAGGGFFVSVWQAWRVFAYEAGMCFVAAAGNISV